MTMAKIGFILIVIACIVFAVGTGIWPILVIMGIIVYFLETL